MKKLLLRITGLIILLLAGGTVNTELLAQVGSASSILVSDAEANNGEEGKMVSLADLLTTLEQNFEVTFLFKDEIVQHKWVNTEKIQIGENTGQQLAGILKQLDLTYSQVDEQTYVLLPKETLLTTKDTAQEQISGSVTDAETGETLAGVNILVKGTSIGASTDSEGNYELTVESLQDTLVVSFIGYKTQQVPINGRTEIDVALQPQAISGEEVVVVGYGEEKKENLTGSIESVGGEEVQDRALGSMTEALQGVAGNLNISTTNLGGEPGATENINIRGLGTLTGNGGEPYVLVDGMPMDISDVDPQNVKNISVLKGPAASAIYGSRGAFGVILIQTKKGERNQPLTVDYNLNFRSAHPVNLPEVAAPLAWVQAINYAAKSSGRPSIIKPWQVKRIKDYQAGKITSESFEDPADPNEWVAGGPAAGNANNEWMDLIFGWTPQWKHNLSFSGGSESTNYNMAVGYYDEAGPMNWVDDYFKRYNFSANINSDITDWLTVNFISKYIRRKKRVPKAAKGRDRTVLWHGMMKNLAINPLYSPRGQMLNDRTREIKLGGRTLDESNEVWLNLGGVLEPIEGWKTNVNYKWNYVGGRNQTHNKLIYYPHYDGTLYEWRYAKGGDSFIENYDDNKHYLLNVRTSYENSVNGKHNFKAMIGYEREYWENRGIRGQKYNLLSQEVPSISTATGAKHVDDRWTHWSTEGIFGRVTYNFEQKYLLEFNGRYDGSSRFDGAENKWGFFPSASVGYNISKEPFWNSIEELTSMNNLKIRGSWGSLGNQSVQNYAYLPIIPMHTNLDWIMGNARPNYSRAPGLINRALTWETINTINVGFDAAFFDNKLKTTFDWFNRRTIDMFGPSRELPAALGTSSTTVNNARLKTTGFELSLSWNQTISEDLNYNISLNLSDNKSTVTKYKNLNEFLGDHYEGQRIGDIWGYETAGFYQSGENADDWVDQSEFYNRWQPGDIKYKDLNGDGKITRGDNTKENPGDRKIIGNSHPRYQFGIKANVNYKGFQLRMFWQGVAQRDVWINGIMFWGIRGSVNQVAGFKPTMDYWTPEGADFGGGPHAYYPRPYTNNEFNKNKKLQTKYLQDASYLRLKNIQLGYTISQGFTNIFKKARIYVGGYNLLTFTSLMDNFDPETVQGSRWGAGKTYPISKFYSVGLNLKF